MSDSGVARTVRQRGAVMAGVGYLIQFLAIAPLWASGSDGFSTVPVVFMLILLALSVRKSLQTYNNGFQKRQEYDRRMVFRWLQGLSAAAFLVCAFVVGSVGSAVFYLLGAASSYLGNETLVSAAKSRDS